jgi:hypothetical protein
MSVIRNAGRLLAIGALAASSAAALTVTASASVKPAAVSCYGGVSYVNSYEAYGEVNAYNGYCWVRAETDYFGVYDQRPTYTTTYGGYKRTSTYVYDINQPLRVCFGAKGSSGTCTEWMD